MYFVLVYAFLVMILHNMSGVQQKEERWDALSMRDISFKERSMYQIFFVYSRKV
jgi:hypothetical protein